MLAVIDPSIASERKLTDAVKKEAKKLDLACREIGFFTVEKTGLTPEEFEQVFSTAQQFFDLPLEQKMQIDIESWDYHRGYGRIGSEQLDPGVVADFKETFDMARNLDETHPGVQAKDPFYGPNQYPELFGFQQTVEEYYQKLSETGLNLLALMAVALELPIDYFDALFDDQTSVLRMIHYPPIENEGQISAGAHTDYGCLTLLAQDSTGGLEVKPKGKDWVKVPYVPNGLVVNIGDLMQRWTNRAYQSTIHRVIPPLGKHRYSIPFFLEPNTKTLVECIPSCVSEVSPCRYEPIYSDDWIKSKFDQTYSYRQK